ncbi:hypothetical protein QE152_g35243 [Popillia japonica]|uniref:Uncharacterized protein n=1 Tax=Popillia japonica TaxID=7064 RepID=A0AAW1IGF9_POPJA
MLGDRPQGIEASIEAQGNEKNGNAGFVQCILDDILKEVMRIDMSNKIKVVDMRPLPKAPPRQNKRKSEPSCSRVYTDTPEQDKIERKEKQKQLKKDLNQHVEAPALKSDVKKRKKAFKQKDNRILKKKTKARGKQTNWLSSSEESDDSKIADKAQTSDSDICLSETDHDEEQLAYLKPDATLQPGDYVLVKFPTKKTIKHYVGQLISHDTITNEYEIRFFRKTRNNGFVLPNVLDSDRRKIYFDTMAQTNERCRNLKNPI